MKFLLLFFLLSLLSLACTLETETKAENQDKIDHVAKSSAALTIDDDELDLLSDMTNPDIEHDHHGTDQSVLQSTSQSKDIEPRACVGRCRSTTNDCVWKCEDDWSRVVKPCHEYRPCSRDRRHCHVLANAQEWAICK